jgi:glycosyltransferase involved in cell wall biosynthesis
MKRLCFVSNAWLRYHGSKYFCFPWFIRLHESFLGLFTQVLLLGASANEQVGNGARLGSQLSTSLELPNVSAQALPMRGGRLRRNISQLPGLWSAIRKADLLCIDMPNETGVLAFLLCKIARRRFFIRFLGDWRSATFFGGSPSVSRRFKALIADLISHSVVRFSPLVFVQGQELYDKHHKDNPSAVVPGIVFSTLGREVFFERIAEPFHKPIRILTVSSLIPLKGLDVFLRALELTLAQGIDAVWWCAGEGPHRASLENHAQTLGVYDRIRFLGHIPFGPDLLRVYREADIFVLPSLTEGVPSSLLEAMAHSMPVVASAVGGIPAIISDGLNGMLVPPGRPDLLAKAISFLTRRHDLVVRMRQAAYRSAQQFDSSVLAERMKNFLESTFGPCR